MIIDIALRRYLGLDEWIESEHPRDNIGRFSKKGLEKNKKTGKIVQGYEEIYLKPDEYAIVERVFNTYGAKRTKMKKFVGGAWYSGIKKDGSWYYVGKE